jgi:AraC family transcriptional regulator
MTVHIKNMVCGRCILVVEQILNQANIPYKNIQLGRVDLLQPLEKKEVEELKRKLQAVGFEWLDDQKSKWVEQIKTQIIALVHGKWEGDMNKKISAILAETLHKDYQYLSQLFSAVEGVTIERFLILQRIERAKELLLYNEMTLSEISYELGYSSVQHLSQQFKKTTGLTPSQFKTIKNYPRKPIDNLQNNFQ